MNRFAVDAKGPGADEALARQIIDWHARGHDALDRCNVSRFKEGSGESFTIAERIALLAVDVRVEAPRSTGTHLAVEASTRALQALGGALAPEVGQFDPMAVGALGFALLGASSAHGELSDYSRRLDRDRAFADAIGEVLSSAAPIDQARARLGRIQEVLREGDDGPEPWERGDDNGR